MQAVGGTVQEGVVVPDVPLPEGTRVEIFFYESLSPNTLEHSDLERRRLEPLTPEAQAAHDYWHGPPAPHLNGDGAAYNGVAANGGVNGIGTLENLKRATTIAPVVPPTEINRTKQRLLQCILVCSLLAGAGISWRVLLHRHNNGIIHQRIVKGQTVEMTADVATDFAGAMRALSTELRRSPHTREVILYFGQPRSMMIYDRQNKSLTSIPGTATRVPCGTFIKGSFFNQVTDDIVHKVARNGDGLDGISYFCGAPSKTVENNCT